jgi:hypothetical protein
MNVSTLAYTPIKGGRLGGVFCLELVLGGQLQVRPLHLLKVIRRSLTQVTGDRPKPPVVIHAMNPIDVPDAEAHEVIATLRDAGNPVHIVSDGMSRPAWFSIANTLIAVVRGPEWLGFEVFELFYDPERGSAWTEPKPTAKVNYLVVPPKVAPADVLTFLTKATALWGIVAPTPTVAAIDFTKELKE